MTSPQRSMTELLSQLLALSLVMCLGISVLASAPTRPRMVSREAGRIVFDNIRPSVGPNRSIRIKASVLDGHGTVLPAAPISWRVAENSQHLIAIDPPYGTKTSTVTIRGLERASAQSGFATLRANSGSVSAALIVQYQRQDYERQDYQPQDYQRWDYSAAARIMVPQPVDLPVGSKQTIKVEVFDTGGNLLKGARVTWQLANPEHESFVLLGPPINTLSTNSIEIAWGAGDPTKKTPSQVPLVVMCGRATNIVLINYKPVAKQKLKIIPDKTELEVHPGEETSFSIKVTGDKGADVTDEVDISTPELLNDVAKKVIVVTGPDDDHKVTLIGKNGGGDTPALVASALLLRVANTSITIPVIYRRDPVSAMWDVIPPKIVGDNYGRTIKMDYYCMEVTIENYSGSDLALAALGFDLNTSSPRPSASYTTVHGSLARRKLTYPRTMALAAISGVGQLMTGFNPFFHNTNHAKNFSQFIDIISNPLEKGTALVWPDSYPDELNRLEQDTLHDDKVIPNNSVYKTKIFFPKRTLFPNGAAGRDDPAAIRDALGELLIFGYKFQRGPLRQLNP